MRPDDKVCYCFHVSLRKLANFARRERPSRASQMSHCLGAGTGCGWCVPILKKIHALALDGFDFEAAERGAGADTRGGLPESSEAYGQGRSEYLRSGDRNTF